MRSSGMGIFDLKMRSCWVRKEDSRSDALRAFTAVKRREQKRREGTEKTTRDFVFPNTSDAET